MTWTVVWHPDATNKLAEIWLQAADRAAVVRATHDIDRTLGDRPELSGVEFYGDRLLDVAPLSVVYCFSEPDRLVKILDVTDLG